MGEQQPQQIGTDAEQTKNRDDHRDPAPSPAEHNQQFRQDRPDDCIGQQ
jgi:hypothetical protein